jgi:hypothetical protein
MTLSTERGALHILSRFIPRLSAAHSQKLAPIRPFTPARFLAYWSMYQSFLLPPSGKHELCGRARRNGVLFERQRRIIL